MARYLKKKEKKPRSILWLLGILIVTIAIVVAVPAKRTFLMNTNTVLETPYCTLSYPNKWANQVRIETSESSVYSVSYYAAFSDSQEIKLFTISFGDETENPAGVIQLENGDTVNVCVSVCALEPDENRTKEEWNVVQEMMDDLNYILERIPFVDVSDETEPTEEVETEPDSTHDMLIETPYAKLVYPGKWKDYLEVTVEQDGACTVLFLAALEGQKPQPLFDIVFAEDGELGSLLVEGEWVGVSAVLHGLALDESWQDEQIEIITAMQEDINYIVERLELTKVSEMDDLEETAPTEDDQHEASQSEEALASELVIDTPYGHLKYPGKWNAFITTRTTETDIYIVEFLGSIGTHEPVHLFSACFGDTVETAIGSVKDANGNVIPFGIIPSTFTPDKDWSEEECHQLYEMMEDVNYLISAILAE